MVDNSPNDTDQEAKLRLYICNLDEMVAAILKLPSPLLKVLLTLLEEKVLLIKDKLRQQPLASEAGPVVKVEMHHHTTSETEPNRPFTEATSQQENTDIKPIDVSNHYDEEEYNFEIEDEIDIVVEENGQITRITSEELDKLKEEFVENGQHSAEDNLEEKYDTPVEGKDIVSDSEDRLGDLNEKLATRQDGKYLCKMCGVMVTNRLKLELHVKSAHPGHAVFRCLKCPFKQYGSAVGLLLHIQNKHPRKASSRPGDVLSCREEGCEYNTPSRQLMRAHIRSHNLNSCLKCPVCGKEYLGGQQAFRAHMKMHTNEKNYACDLCEKRFVSQSRLTYHRTNVHEPARFQCHDCSKLFRSKVNFERHLLIHTEERPFQCDMCEYKARNSTNLTSHVKTVHKMEDFTVGKKDKVAKKRLISKKIIDQKRIKDGETVVDSPEVLAEVMGNMEASGYIGSLVGEERVSIEQLKEEEKHSLGKRNKTKNEMKKNHTAKRRRGRKKAIEPDFVPQIVTLTNDKGDLIKAIISVEEEKVEEDGIVMGDTQVLGQVEGEVVYQTHQVEVPENIVYIMETRSSS